MIGRRRPPRPQGPPSAGFFAPVRHANALRHAVTARRVTPNTAPCEGLFCGCAEFGLRSCDTIMQTHQRKEPPMEQPMKRPHGVRAKGWTSPQVLEGLRLVEQGVSWRAAAEQAGCNVTSIWAARARKQKEAEKCQTA